MSTYTYEPLDPSKREIRLIRILDPLRSSNSERVECIIKRVSLDSTPKYAALSYLWGINDTAKRITMNGNTFEISESLERTLQGLRDLRLGFDSGDVYWWWIDALCINQTNDVEKSTQVQQMCSIYKSADLVLVWLRDTAYCDKWAIRTLGVIFNEIDDLKFWDSTTDDPQLQHQRKDYLREFIHRASLEMEDFGSMPFFAADDKDWVRRRALGGYGSEPRKSEACSRSYPVPVKPLMSFFGHLWWTRVWVLQELAVAKRAFFTCGGELIHWLPLLSILYMLRDLEHQTLADHPGDVRYTTLVRILSYSATRGSPFITAYERSNGDSDSLSIYDFLAYHIYLSTLESSDPRDKVFAFLGLTNSDGKRGIIANYSEPAQDLFARVTRAMIRENGLGILQSCCGVDLPDDEPGSRLISPSWVPQWFVNLAPVRGTDGLPSSLGFVDLSSSRFSVIPPLGRILSLGGFLVDEIVAVSSVLPVTLRLELEDTSWESFKIIRGWLEETRELYAKTTHQNVSGLSLLFDQAANSAQSQEPDRIDPHATAATPNNLHPLGYVYGSRQQSVEALWRMPIEDNTIQHGGRFPTDILQYGYLVLMGHIDPPVEEEDHKQWYIQRSAEYRQVVKVAATNKLCFVSSQGYLGLGRPSVSTGDLIVLFDGASVPFIVRRGENSKFRLVGEAYVYGIKDGGESVGTASIELY